LSAVRQLLYDSDGSLYLSLFYYLQYMLVCYLWRIVLFNFKSRVAFVSVDRNCAGNVDKRQW